MSSRFISVLLVTLLVSYAHADPAYKLVHADVGGNNLLTNDGWHAINGATRADGVFVCENGADATVQRGFSQTVVLNQTTPRPIVAAVWSRAQDVGGSKDSDYSLYLDLQYADGQPLWGQTADFRTGTHDWQKAQVKIFPTKPVKQVTIHLLLRRHTGSAQFKEPRLFVLQDASGLAWLDGIAVTPREKPAGGFLMRDVAKDSDYFAFDEQRQAMGLKLDATDQQDANARRLTATLTDTTGQDRAITLIYGVPLTGEGWRWLSDARRSPAPPAGGEYLDATHFSAGANGMLSRYPLAAVSHAAEGRHLPRYRAPGLLPRGLQPFGASAVYRI